MAEAELAWSSTDTTVASVDSSGLVTAAGNGEATITATSGEVSGTTQLTVEQSVATVAVTPDVIELTALDDTVPLTAEARDQNDNAMAEAVLVWSSSDASVAAVDSSGLVTAAGNGEATITASSGEANATATLTVEQTAASVSVTPDATKLTALADTVLLAAEVLDRNGNVMTEAALGWSSSDTSVASADASGLVTAMGFGATTITAISGEVSVTVTLAVEQVEAIVSVIPDTVRLTALGDTASLEAEVRDGNGNVMAGADLAWSSTDTSVVSVDSSGLVTAIGNGAAMITATSGEAGGTVMVTVEQSVATVTVTPDTMNLTALGESVTLTAEARDRNGSVVADAVLVWSSSDDSVASVDASGLVTAKGNGEATITASSSESSATATLTVAQTAASVAVTPGQAKLTALGDSVPLTAEVLDRNGNVMAEAILVWSSSEASVASVDASGLVTAVGYGATAIRAVSGEASGTATSRVEQTAATVIVTPDAWTLTALGDTKPFAAEVLDRNGNVMTEAEFDWSSTDASVAMVDASGLVTAVGNGAVTITASSGDASMTAIVQVAQEISRLVVEPVALTPAQAGKQGTDTIVVTALDSAGSPVSHAGYRWSTDRHSGWVYPSQGTTDKLGRIHTTWVAGWPGEGSLSLTVENEFSRVTRELDTESTTPNRPPAGAAYIWVNTADYRNSGYSIDMTPLAEPKGTFYAAIQWDGGYVGLQRGGSLYDRQLQFSVWDAPGYGDAELIDNASDVRCRTFGGEGTGVACELSYPWEVGETFRFEVTEEEMNGGSAITLYVTDLAEESRRFVGTIRFARRAKMSSFGMFVEDFVQRAPHCLAREVRGAAIRRPRAWIDGAWVALDELTDGLLSLSAHDPWNPGTPGCGNVAVRNHVAGLELVIGGETASDPNATRQYTVPSN